MQDSVKLMNTVIQNILKNPGVDKYCKLKLSNDKIKKCIGDSEQAIFILEMLGFEKLLMVPDGATQAEPYLVLNSLRCDQRDM